mgnify:FL=1|tara:strand:- start:160 stop:357 length:198 start_codon:yes stop_codon:yes gene_type:complete
MADYQLRKFTFNRVDKDGNDVTVNHEDVLDKRLTPNRAIPKDPANTDYQKYLEWVAEGNTADAAD